MGEGDEVQCHCIESCSRSGSEWEEEVGNSFEGRGGGEVTLCVCVCARKCVCVCVCVYSSRMMRRLALMAHFGSLSSGCGDHTHFLDSAPVLQVAWSDIAIHVLDKQVSS